MTATKVFKIFILIIFGPLWAWQNLWGYGRKVHAKFWPWGMPWDRFMTIGGAFEVCGVGREVATTGVGGYGG